MAIISRKTRRKGIVYDVYFRDLNKREYSKTFYRLKDAQVFQADLISKKARDEFPEIFAKRERITFKELSDKWLAEYSRVHKAPSSTKRDEGILKNYLVPVFGGTEISRITTASIQTYMTKRLNTVANKTKRQVTKSTVNREFEVLRKIFNDGIVWRLLKTNPCKGLKKYKEERRKAEYLTDIEVRAFLNASRAIDKPLFAAAVYTGMRLGELLNLKWSNVDLKQARITVEIGSEKSGRTKSGKIRWIPISSALMPYLSEIKGKNSTYVFHSKILGTETPRNDVRKAFHAAIKRAGIKRHIRFHDLRHTFASHFVMKGGDLLALKELLGHADLVMVQRYAHLAPEHLRDAVEKLNFN